MIAVSTYAGVDIRGNVLKFNPHLPAQWKKMKFRFRFKGIHYHFEITNDSVRVSADKKSVVLINGEEYQVNKVADIKYQ